MISIRKILKSFFDFWVMVIMIIIIFIVLFFLLFGKDVAITIVGFVSSIFTIFGLIFSIKVNKETDDILKETKLIANNIKENSLNLYRNFLIAQCFQNFHMFKEDPENILKYRMETLGDNEQMNIKVQKRFKNGKIQNVNSKLSVIPIGTSIDWMTLGEVDIKNGNILGYLVEVVDVDPDSHEFILGEKLFIKPYNSKSIDSDNSGPFYKFFKENIDEADFFFSNLSGIMGSNTSLFNVPNTISEINIKPLIRKLE